MSGTKTASESEAVGSGEAGRSADQVRELVRDAYGKVATRDGSCGCCCGGGASPVQIAKHIGYTDAQIGAAPAESNLGLGCGNPTAIAALMPGEVVLDLGAGGGFDALLAARAVGPTGRVIGVDMTPDMLARARAAAERAGLADTVEFREGVIEALPVDSNSVDVVISNCVVNLSPEKAQVFRETFRVLRPGGRLAISDIVLSQPLSERIAEIAAAWVGCVAGAALEQDYLGAIAEAGFTDVRTRRTSAADLVACWRDDPQMREAIAAIGEEEVARAAASVWSLGVEATKPRGTTDG